MNICMVASRHTVDDARIVHKEAQSLLKAGHEVSLLFACNERYEYTRFDGQVIVTGTAPDGAVTHLGCRLYGKPKRAGLAGKWRTYRETADLAAAIGADVYHAHEPDLSLAVAIRAKRLLARQGRRALVVHDLHEYPPGEAAHDVPPWLAPAAAAAMRCWDHWTAGYVDHVFTANSIVRGYLLPSLPPHAAADVLYNGPALRLFPQRPPEGWTGSRQPLVLCHEGSLGFERGLREMVEAVDRLRERVHLRIIGDVFGAERAWLEHEIAARGLEGNISRTGWLPYASVGQEFRCAHVGLILFRDVPGTRLAGPPNKLFNYMNAGLPVLSVGLPELRRVIREERCGVLVEDQSVEAIVRGLERLLSSPEALCAMGAAGQRAVRERYSWECMEEILLAAYEDLAAHLKRA